MNQWLIRTHKNEIEGPFSKDDVIARIREGKLGPDDEVCLANHYWFYLDEREEVNRQLGIEMPRPPRDDTQDTDEITLTETSEVSGEHSAGGSSSSAPSRSGDSGYSSSSVMGTMSRPRDPTRYPGVPLPQPIKPVVVGRAEEGIWRILGTLLVVLTSGLVIWIIRILQTAK